jgi:hypothetical protein
MRKKVFGGALALTLAFAGIAQATSTDLTGATDGGGTISMTVVKKGTFKVKDLQFYGVPINCNHGKFTVGADTSGYVFTVDSVGRFGATLWPGQHSPPPNKLRIHGKLTNGGNDAHGRLRLHGDKVVVEGRTKKQNGCDTGRVDWTAGAA